MLNADLSSNGDGTFETNQRLLYDTNPVNPSFHEVVQIIDESTGNRRNVFLNGPQPDMVLVDEVFTPSGTPSDILWLLQDHQNTVTDVATMASSGNSTATLVNHLEYNAFGTITSQTNSAYQPLQTYTGQILDTATGLLYYDARWYDPGVAQFVSEDPIGFAAGDANLRRYVGNSMPNAVDPTGLDFVDVDDQIAIWVEEDSLGRNGQSHDLGHVEGDTITLRPQYGGGQISLSRLKAFVDAGLRHNSLFMGVSTLTGLSDEDKQFSIRFAISEVYFRTNNATYRAGDQCDEEGNITASAGANGPLAAILIVHMIRQVAIDLAIEFAGGTAITAIAKGGKLFLRAGGETIELTVEQVAKKLGKNADEVDLAAIARQLDGKKLDDVYPDGAVSSAANGVIDFAESTGRLGGRLWGADRIPTLTRFLEKRGVKVLLDQDEFLAKLAKQQGLSGADAAFIVGNDGKLFFLLSKNPTRREVLHELSHYLHRQKIGGAAYDALTKPQKEAWVSNFLRNSNNWKNFTSEEQWREIQNFLKYAEGLE